LGRTYNTGIKKTGTAILGSFILIHGISSYVGHLPSLFTQPDEIPTAPKGQQLYYTIGYFVAFLVFAFLGALYQFRKLEDDSGEDENFKDQDEGRCCGLF